MVAGDLKTICDSGRVDSERIGGAALKELLLQDSEGGGSVGEDELGDRKEAVLERLPPTAEVYWIW